MMSDIQYDLSRKYELELTTKAPLQGIFYAWLSRIGVIVTQAVGGGKVRILGTGTIEVDAGIIKPMSFKPALTTLGTLLLFGGIFMAACDNVPQSTPSASATISVTIEPSPTPTPLPPTPIPLVALVNGEPITLAEFQAELNRLLAAQEQLGNAPPLSDEAAKQWVLDDLINQVLLAQGAYQAGFTLDEAEVLERIEQLVTQLGSGVAFEKWLTANYYTTESFYQALARNIASAWMRDEIAASVPEQVEQIHARQILVYNVDQAEELLAQLQAGADFLALATRFDPLGRGNLGWFPRGYLLVVEVEEAAFALQPGEVSGIIESQAGYHIIQVIDRDPRRPLDPQARLVLQEQALQKWLADKRESAEIDVLLPRDD
ncbi:MAG: peptidylprolyl isomerase [Chloroflexota bacterium]